MGLIKKIFRSSRPPEEEPPTSQGKSRNAPRREMVQVVLRDTMRQHGVPSDWIECRILVVTDAKQRSGMHVQFLVRKGDEQLLTYVHAFQESFWQAIEKFEPRAREWLFSVAWQFDGKAARGVSAVADAPGWATAEAGDTQPPDAGDTQPPQESAEDLESDLQALYAAISQRGELVDLPPAQPRPHRK